MEGERRDFSSVPGSKSPCRGVVDLSLGFTTHAEVNQQSSGGDYARPPAPTQMQNMAQQMGYGPPNPTGSPRMGYPGAGGHWFPDSNNYEDYDDDANNGVGDDNDNDGAQGGRDSKRRRIARACDMCRKKKIKCDGKMPKCGHCENYKTECIFTQQEKKRAPPKGAKYIEGLENRLGRMEHLLRLSGLLAEDNGQTDLGTLERRLQERQSVDPRSDGATPQSQHSSSRAGGAPNAQTPATGSTPQEQITSPRNVTSPQQQQQPDKQAQQNPFKKDAKEVDVLADQMCSLITNNCGETRYIGSSSGFSIFSPKGIQWVNQKTGDSSFQQMIATAAADDKTGWEHWRPEVFNDLFSRRVFKPLPARQECYALLKDYFENFNCMFPLFHEPTFMHLVDKHYSLDPYEGSGWWASLNVALAIAHRLRVMSNVVGQEEDDHAWGYLKNAMAVMTELTMRNTDLLSVQALLGMALFLQGTPNPQPSFFLVAAAIRLAHSIGLHKRGSGFNLNDVENEQRKRVFWIAYLLDKDICLRSGRPPAQDDDDMNVDLPSEDPPDNVGNILLTTTNTGTVNGRPSEDGDAKKTMNLFRLMCTFAQIQSRVYKSLYSVRASRQSDGELLNTIGDLDDQLEKWKDSIPMDYRPEHEIKAAHTPLILHVVVLHFAYYNCLTTIHRMSVHHGYWTSRLSDYAIQGLNARPLNPRVFMSAALCVNAARTSIGLIRYIPQGDYACVWLILYYPVSSLVTLFANILQNPQDARARSDLRLMSSVVSFLSMLERDAAEANGNIKRMLSVCAEFERIARVVLDKAEREMRGRGKRKAGPLPPESAAAAGKKSRESGQAIKDAIGDALDEGKTLEQMQVETQAAYRRPVNTPSLAAASHAGSAAGTSPASWGQSPPGGTGPEYGNGPGPGGILGGTQWASGFNGAAFDRAAATSGPSPSAYPLARQNATTNPYSFHSANAAGVAPPPDFGGFDPSSIDPNLDFNPDLGDLSSGTAGGGGAGVGGLGGPFQQPFVPQDLWQMPMTLEWDWAEGLGLGSFAPGPMFEGADGFGLGGGGNEGGRMEGMQR